MGGSALMQALMGRCRPRHALPRRSLRSSPACKRALALLTWAAAAARTAAQPEASPRRLSTSVVCREALDAMVNDVNWFAVHNTSSHWCRIRFENQMAHCCDISNFPQGTAEMCDASKCVTDCRHMTMATFCTHLGGQACLVRRNPFTRTGPFSDVRLSDAPSLEVHETFCVPNECNNGPDRDELMQWYNVRYRPRRSGWQANYDQAILECDSGILTIILITIACIGGILCCMPILWYVCVSPKEKGKTLVSQAEMNADNPDVVEPMDGKSTRDGFGMSGMQASFG